MKSCKFCGMPHPPTVHTEKYVNDRGFPRSDPKYATAHEEASKAEKKAFPRKDYNKLKHMDKSVGKHELIGKNSKKGKITISEKIPKKLRPEVIFHEKTENKKLLKKK